MDTLLIGLSFGVLFVSVLALGCLPRSTEQSKYELGDKVLPNALLVPDPIHSVFNAVFEALSLRDTGRGTWKIDAFPEAGVIKGVIGSPNGAEPGVVADIVTGKDMSAPVLESRNVHLHMKLSIEDVTKTKLEWQFSVGVTVPSSDNKLPQRFPAEWSHEDLQLIDQANEWILEAAGVLHA